MHEGDQNSRLIEQIRHHGWHQGSVIPGTMADDIFRDRVDATIGHDNAKFLVLSHDCDVVHHDLIAEPTIEIISFKRVAAGDGNLLHGKNPRRLHLSDPSGSQYFEFCAKDRLFCDRKLFSRMAPDTAMVFSDDQIRCLIQWIALRYVRTAFPDSFNDRLRPAASRLNRLLKSGGTYITCILVAMDMGELHDDKSYNLILFALMREQDFENASRKAAAIEVLNQIESIINSGCRGIDVKETLVRSENEMTIAEFWMLHRLEFDHLSQGENNAGPSPRI